MELWKIEDKGPTIVSGPTVSKVTQNTALIEWVTDEESDSIVKFDAKAGILRHRVSDPNLVKQHEVTLILDPSTVYHCVVESTNAGGNTATSDEFFVETKPPFDTEPPTIESVTITRGPTEFEYWTIEASVSDNVGVERVEFYMDGRLLRIDYSAESPYEGSIIPATMEITRDEFFTEHTVETRAFDTSGLVAEASIPFAPPYEVQDVSVDIYSPCNTRPDGREYPGSLYTDDSVVSDGTFVEITACACENEWCEDGGFAEPEVPGLWPEPRPGVIVPHPVPRVEFYVDGREVGACSMGDECFQAYHNDYYYTCEWNASGSDIGVYDIEARAIASDESVATAECTVEVHRGWPEIMYSKTVSRSGRYFMVTLTIENRGTARAQLDRITEEVVGFQCIRETTENYSVTTDYSTASKSCDIEIDLFSDRADTITLPPDEHLTVEYSMVPILYTDATDYSIEEETVLYYDDLSGASHERSWSSCGWWSCRIDDERLVDSLDSAFGVSNYLIITHPSRLFTNYIDADVQELLSTMASLVKEKNGTLGYLRFGTFDHTDVKNLIEPGGDWNSSLTADWTSTGYLLIVGETEIVPARDISDSRIADATSINPVHYVDNWYADMTGSDNLPDLIVGRIIGDSANQLMTPIQTSLLDLFYRTDALVASGIGTGESSFRANADEVEGILDDEFTVDQMYGSDYTTNAQRQAQFRTRALDKDVIYWRDHGCWNCWSNTICEWDFPVNFGTGQPFAFANACLTGNYEDTSPRTSVPRLLG